MRGVDLASPQQTTERPCTVRSGHAMGHQGIPIPRPQRHNYMNSIKCASDQGIMGDGQSPVDNDITP